MAIFIGTEQEFNKFIGPRVRNRINALARAAKHDRGLVCEHCGRKVDELEAAHIHGRDRKTIVHEILESYLDGETYRVDLDAFERQLDAAHSPIGNVVLFLCPECHRTYDRSCSAEAKSDEVKLGMKSGADVPAATANPDAAHKPSNLSPKPGESNKAYVTRVFEQLYRGGKISDYELNRLCSHDADDEEYRLRTFGFTRPLLVTSDADRVDERGYQRYYADKCCGHFFLCSQWYRENNSGHNLGKFQQWAEKTAQWNAGDTRPVAPSDHPAEIV
ncbi:hypothetical protein [Candidatus Collinsella stercoripullorum]|uniref:hypothetical protein n=1 Tax=Candidatus Collinsella stercoripullorum TaxID=2838522 RepID=UPI0022E9796C|nr:hypothetical protein [Candidatus Collinsella stercoripullorum]